MNNLRNKVNYFHDSDPIILNVGGTEEVISKNILLSKPDSFFHVMFSGQINLMPMTNKPNTYFINGDGEVIKYVLNYLRYGKDYPIPDQFKSRVSFLLNEYRIKPISDILDFNQIDTILTWLGNHPQKTFDLIFKGSRDGFSASSFHEKCDYKGPTVTVIKTQDGSIFGGFNSQPWNCERKGYYGDNKCFIFTLVNPHRIPPTKYIPVHNNNNYVFGREDCMPTFGAGHDIYISDKCNANLTSHQRFPSTYQDTTGQGATTFTSSPNFVVEEIEVFRVKI